MSATTPNPAPLPIDPAAGADECALGDADGLLDAAFAEECTAVAKALADPTRIRLLAYVAAVDGGTVCACHLPERLGISQPTLSHHLKRLVDAGLLERSQRGRWAHYALVDGALDGFAAFVAAPGAAGR